MARVQVVGMESSSFQVRKGVRQGCPLFPWLFNIFIDRRVSEARNKLYGSVRLTTGDVELHFIVDDLMVMAKSEAEEIKENRKKRVMWIGRKQDDMYNAECSM